jgi:phosphoribosylformylglycinamidine synthase I
MDYKPEILIITGYGLNCEAESEFAWRSAGARTRRLHLKDLIAQPDALAAVDGLMLIGGFSFGDHLGSGHVFAARLRRHLREPLQQFIADGKLILGVCNGFQIMTRLGLLPGLDGAYFSPKVALTHNDIGAFQNFWITARFEPGSPCVFTRGLDRMDLPIRHGEGRLLIPDRRLLARLEASGCVACRYIDPVSGAPAAAFPHNPNGSVNAIAGLCDPTGRVFGLMPHPEAYVFSRQHPRWDLSPGRKEPGKGLPEPGQGLPEPGQGLPEPGQGLPKLGQGLKLFQNAVRYLTGRPAQARPGAAVTPRTA